MKTYIYLPSLSQNHEELNLLLRLGGCLQQAGLEVAFVASEEKPWFVPGGLADMLAPGVPLYYLDAYGMLPAHRPAEQDIWLVTEQWPSGLTPGLEMGCRVMIYVQNWTSLLSKWPERLRRDNPRLFYLAVSRPVAWYIHKHMGREAEVLRPGIDLALLSAHSIKSYHTAETQAALGKVQRPPRIARMSHINQALAKQIGDGVDSQRRSQGKSAVEWLEMEGQTDEAMAATLQQSDIFFATGFPEGLPRLPLAAMAAGCVCVGFSSFGGLDYMRQLPPQGGMGIFPSWAQEELGREAEPRPGNGLWLADEDVAGAARALEQVLAWQESGDPGWECLQAGARATAELYSQKSFEETAVQLWLAMQSVGIMAAEPALA